MQTPSVVVGIDVAKAYLDVAVRPAGESLRVPYDAPGGWNGPCCVPWWTRPCP